MIRTDIMNIHLTYMKTAINPKTKMIVQREYEEKRNPNWGYALIQSLCSMKILSFVWRLHLAVLQRLFLAVYLENTPGGAQGSLWGARDRTRIGSVQSSFLSTVLLLPFLNNLKKLKIGSEI